MSCKTLNVTLRKREPSIFGGLVGGHESEGIRPSRRISVFAARYSTSDRPREGMGVFKRVSNILGQLDKRLGEKYETEEGLTLEILLEEIAKSKMYCKDVLMKPRHSKTSECLSSLHTLPTQMPCMLHERRPEMNADGVRCCHSLCPCVCSRQG